MSLARSISRTEVLLTNLGILSSTYAVAAMPFHSKDSKPQAACPRCINDHGDETLKDMYAIHGLQKGEYDSVIPDEWLQSPPTKLDIAVPGMGAIRVRVESSQCQSTAKFATSSNTSHCHITLAMSKVTGAVR